MAVCVCVCVCKLRSWTRPYCPLVNLTGLSIDKQKRHAGNLCTRLYDTFPYLPLSAKYISQFFSLMAFMVTTCGVGGVSCDDSLLNTAPVDDRLAVWE